MEIPKNRPDIKFSRVGSELLPEYYPTDAQFSIARYRGETRGFDLIDPRSRRRLYLTVGSSEEAEAWVARSVPGISLEQAVEVQPHPSQQIDGHVPQVYRVPEGTRLLIKTLDQSPYHAAYMRRIGHAAGALLRKLHRLDPGQFGIGLDNIALTHNGGDNQDDSELRIVPPLAAPGEVTGVHATQDLHVTLQQLDDNLRRAILDGYSGGNQ
ncbi:hypothetical protein KC951_01835 [Candidatus Saccharibacteria bacterium]|nr:hypothetical protein [Candidatus Saccharibacteria bacterium]